MLFAVTFTRMEQRVTRVITTVTTVRTIPPGPVAGRPGRRHHPRPSNRTGSPCRFPPTRCRSRASRTLAPRAPPATRNICARAPRGGQAVRLE
ncbi:hypothetical protein SNE510_49780 [Streptomyces sp. NE5-10]|nr:hypothetical protein SNE510_49780 [Streptomyces sp. NE5-10]